VDAEMPQGDEIRRGSARSASTFRQFPARQVHSPVRVRTGESGATRLVTRLAAPDALLSANRQAAQPVLVRRLFTSKEG
jgi:hypothetical protein